MSSVGEVRAVSDRAWPWLLVLSSVVGAGCGPAVQRDLTRGLDWQARASSPPRSWEAAKRYCEELELEGRGWRLPSEVELGALYHDPSPAWQEYRGWSSGANTSQAGFYWTSSAGQTCDSTTAPSAPLRAWAVACLLPVSEPGSILTVETTNAARGALVCIDASEPARVRCVRGHDEVPLDPKQESRR